MAGAAFGMKLGNRSGFFDRKKVINALSRAEHAVLSRFGANVRKRAQRSIQIREGAASPGSPPHGHKTTVRKRVSKSTGRVRMQMVSPLREHIEFDWAGRSLGVVIGPKKLNQRVGNAPEALEKGGMSQIMTTEKGQRVKKRVRIRKRPYMIPAFNEEKQKPYLNKLWKNSIKP